MLWRSIRSNFSEALFFLSGAMLRSFRQSSLLRSERATYQIIPKSSGKWHHVEVISPNSSRGNPWPVQLEASVW